MDKIDIVIIHKGFNKYLYYSVVQAKKTNPNSTIYILGDKKYNILEKYSTFININTLESDDSKLFEKSYFHLGKSDWYFEMFCIKRWFILKNFMKLFNIKSILHIDSDIMLFCDMTELLNSMMCVGGGQADVIATGPLALTMCVNNVSVLDDFCNYVLDIYTNEYKLNELKKYYFSGRHLEGVAGSISDMHFSSNFFKNTKYSFLDISKIYNNSIFDGNILAGSPNFKIRKKLKYEMKYIYFRDATPYSIYTDDRGTFEVKLNSLHFIVWSKIYIKRAFENKDLDFNPIFINIHREYVVLIKKLNKLKSKILNVFFKKYNN